MSWVDTKFGRRLLAEECASLDKCARRLHGDALLWSGPVPDAAQCLRRCMAPSRLYLADVGRASPEGLSGLAASLCALPLRNASLNGLVLHHSLEAQADPRPALREVSRVLAPGGRLVVCTFNGFSAWGLRRLYGRFRQDVFSDLKFINPLRLFDWLTLLGLELDGRPRYLGYGAPLDVGQPSGKVAAWLGGALRPVGGVLLLSAIKQAQGADLQGRAAPLRNRRLAVA